MNTLPESAGVREGRLAASGRPYLVPGAIFFRCSPKPKKNTSLSWTNLLKYGLAMVLSFIGAKMLIAPWYHLPTAASLAVVAIILTASIIASVIATRPDKPKQPQD